MPPAGSFGRGSSLELSHLIPLYRDGKLSPPAVIADVLNRVENYGDPAVWITRLSADQVYGQLEASLKRKEAGAAQPLFGIPFAVKDNIDVEGQPTTAACPAFRYVAKKSATVVQRLCDAGAIVIGKANLDQFATGLVGTRSPFGACKNVYDGRYISGGSSSGSSVAVAAGLVSFALGTDTAGSGRVPAALQNLVGLKASKGAISAAGVVPACQSLDCVSIFTHNCDEARFLFRIARGYDASDPYSRVTEFKAEGLGSTFRFGVLARADREFFGDGEAEALYDQSIKTMEKLGGTAVTIDFGPFVEAASLLYFGPWVAERGIVAKDLLREKSDAIFPVTRGILETGLKMSGTEVFEGLHKLEALRQKTAPQWKQMDVLLLPTTGTIYTIDQVLADPLKTNTNLGRYTNFVNLLDLCAVAVPAGFRSNGLPAGVSLIGPAGADEQMLALGERLQKATFPQSDFGMALGESAVATGRLKLAVVGAHLSGMPLNHQLTDRGASLVRACKTAAVYRLYALPGTKPPKPGMVRVREGKGVSIQLEIWEMDAKALGDFVAAIPAPLGIGTIQIEDGSSVQGFLCEAIALEGATDISQFGGWRAYIGSIKGAS